MEETSFLQNSHFNDPLYFIFPPLDDSSIIDSKLIAVHHLDSDQTCSYLAFTFSSSQLRFYSFSLMKGNVTDHFSKSQGFKIQDTIQDYNIKNQLQTALNSNETPQSLQLIQKTSESNNQQNYSPFFKGGSCTDFLAAALLNDSVVLINFQINDQEINGSQFQIKQMKISRQRFCGNVQQLFLHSSSNELIVSYTSANSTEIIKKYFDLNEQDNFNKDKLDSGNEEKIIKIGYYDKNSEIILQRGIGVSTDLTVIRVVVKNENLASNRFSLDTYQIQQTRIQKSRKPLNSMLSDSTNSQYTECQLVFSASSSFLSICDGNTIEVHDFNNHTVKNIIKENSQLKVPVHNHQKLTYCLDKNTLLVANSLINNGISLYNLDNPIAVLETIPPPNRNVSLLQTNISSPISRFQTPNSKNCKISQSFSYLSPSHNFIQSANQFGQIKSTATSRTIETENFPSSAMDLMDLCQLIQKQKSSQATNFSFVLAFMTDSRIVPILIDKEQLDLKLPELCQINSQITQYNRTTTNNDDSINFFNDFEMSSQKSNKYSFDIFKTPDRKGSFSLNISSLDNAFSKSLLKNSSQYHSKYSKKIEGVQIPPSEYRDRSLSFEIDYSSQQGQYKNQFKNRLLFMESSSNLQVDEAVKSNLNSLNHHSQQSKKEVKRFMDNYTSNQEQEIKEKKESINNSKCKSNTVFQKMIQDAEVCITDIITDFPTSQQLHTRFPESIEREEQNKEESQLMSFQEQQTSHKGCMSNQPEQGQKKKGTQNSSYQHNLIHKTLNSSKSSSLTLEQKNRNISKRTRNLNKNNRRTSNALKFGSIFNQNNFLNQNNVPLQDINQPQYLKQMQFTPYVKQLSQQNCQNSHLKVSPIQQQMLSPTLSNGRSCNKQNKLTSKLIESNNFINHQYSLTDVNDAHAFVSEVNPASSDINRSAINSLNGISQTSFSQPLTFTRSLTQTKLFSSKKQQNLIEQSIDKQICPLLQKRKVFSPESNQQISEQPRKILQKIKCMQSS